MKVFFDTNVYIAEALLGATAEELVEVTEIARWRIFVSEYVLDEVVRVLTIKLKFSRRLAWLTKQRIRRRTTVIEPGALHHSVPHDSADSPILNAAVTAGVDYLVTNDAHLLSLNPDEGLRIVSMREYAQVLIEHGLRN